MIGLLFAFVIPNFARAPLEDRRNTCIGNLYKIGRAKIGYAVSDRANKGKLTMKNVFGENPPVCPSGGVYDLGTYNQEPSCSIPGHAIPRR